jgi:hypothetical protein
MYQSRRRPVKTTARDCAIRGGEYVVHDRANYATALQVWLPQAQAGDAEAQTYVGDIYQQGLGTAPRYDLAAEWYRKAADQGNTRGRMSLGYLYENGLGVAKDQQQARRWYGTTSVQQSAAPVEESGLSDRERKELEALRKEVEQSRENTNRLRRQLEEAQQELEHTRRELERRQGSVDAQRAALDKERQTLEARKSSPATSPAELQQLERVLSGREAQLDKQRAEIERLRAEADNRARAEAGFRQDLVALQEKLTNLPPPLIEINDPLVLSTRGVRLAMVEPDQADRMVSGKVWSPAGVAQFTVNGKKEALQADGKFAVTVPVRSGGDTDVLVIAVDDQGRTGSVRFSLKPQEGAGKAGSASDRFAGIKFGKYYALIIGNIDYQRMPKLKTAVNDANRVGEILRTKYDFEVQVLRNASRLDIFRTLEGFLRKLNDQDNFLLYYAGHGELDSKNRRGYWLPVDADPNSRERWIPNVEITDYLNIMSAKQVLVIADACYAGIMTRSAITTLQPGMSVAARRNFLERLSHQHARMVLSSGEVQPVLDAGGGDHSVFAKVLIDVLQSNNEVIEGFRLYQQINERVLYNSEAFGLSQVPQYSALIPAGHDSGDFILVPQR